MPQSPSAPLHGGSTSRYIMTALAIIVAITALILIALNAFSVQRRLSIRSLDPYTAGYNAARVNFAKMCPAISQTMTSAQAVVTSASNGTLNVQLLNTDVDERADGVSTDRTVVLDANGTVTKQIMKTPAAFTAEMEAYKPSAKTTPPLPYESKNISLSDIKAGDRILIIADQDIRFVPDISAQKIIVQ